jgi:hypothetical protein
MPTPEQILAELRSIANQGQSIAAVWHILVFMVLVGLVSGWRPSRRFIASTLVLPVLSVAVMASIHWDFFNGIVFTGLAIILVVMGLRMPPTAVGLAPRWALSLGIATALFGLVYPRFLQGGSLFGYLYAAPTGLVPCATLAFAIGVALIVDGMGSRAWALILAVAGLFYGVFGLARLGVALDLGLVIGAAALLGRGVQLRRAG